MAVPCSPTVKPRILVAPSPDRLDAVCSVECRALLEQHFDVDWNDTGREFTADELTGRLRGAAALVTSWGTPSLTEEALAQATELRAVAHAAGTVKRLVPRTIFDRGVAVFSAAVRIADTVGEYCLAVTLASLRQLPTHNTRMHAGQWKDMTLLGNSLVGKRIGIIGASSTGRAFIRLLAPFGVDIVVYDPYFTDAAAAAIGVRRAELPEVMQCDVVSVHVPAIPATEGMITRELLARLPDGALFVNSARAASVDEEALYAEISSGRIRAALDVYITEPPTLPEVIRDAPNALLTPHIAGGSREGHQALMETVVRDVIGWLERGESGRTKVDARAWDIAA